MLFRTLKTGVQYCDTCDTFCIDGKWQKDEERKNEEL